MNTWTRVLLAIAIGAVIGSVLGVAAGLVQNNGLTGHGRLLVGISSGISAGVVALVMRPRPTT